MSSPPFAFGQSGFGVGAFGTPPPTNQANILARLQSLMPNGWFPNGAVPLRDAILTGFANMFAFIFSLLGYVRLQTRIATATDGFLDLIAYDFFANDLARSSGQTDGSFRNQIIAYLFRERNTRDALSDVIEQLLGTTPTIIEPQRVADTGAYDFANTLAYDVPGAGVYGDSAMPLECFVTVTIPFNLSIAPPLVAGYGVPVGAYGTPSQIEYIGLPTLAPVLLADIYAALNSVRPITGVIWTQVITA